MPFHHPAAFLSPLRWGTALMFWWVHIQVKIDSHMYNYDTCWSPMKFFYFFLFHLRWGGYCLWKWDDVFTYRGFLISMFSLLFSVSGLGMAAWVQQKIPHETVLSLPCICSLLTITLDSHHRQGATDRDKAKAAGDRIFALVERESAIDPLSDDGYKGE